MKEIEKDKIMEKVENRGDGVGGCGFELAIRRIISGNYYDVKKAGKEDISSRFGKIEVKSGGGELAIVDREITDLQEMVEIAMNSLKCRWFVYCVNPFDCLGDSQKLAKRTYVLDRNALYTYLNGFQKVLTNGNLGKHVSPIRSKVSTSGSYRIALQTPSKYQLEKLEELGTRFDLWLNDQMEMVGR